MPDVDLKHALSLKPEEAINYFKSKGFAFSWDWHDLWQEAHATSFTVAKAMRTDILQDIRNVLQKCLDDGISFQQFKNELTPKLKAKGWWGKHETMDPSTGELHLITLGSPHRLRTIYETNIQTSYMVGHYKAAMENVADRPWWMYVAVMDKRTRPTHSALNGLVYRYDDPFWKSHHPQNGFRCRCGVRYLDDYGLGEKIKSGDAAKRSSVGPDADTTFSTIEKPLTKDGAMTPVTSAKTRDLTGKPFSMAPDPGWNYNPGKAGSGAYNLVATKLPRWDADLGSRMYEEIKPAARKAINTNYAEWVEKALSGKPKRDFALLGAMSPVDVSFLMAKGKTPVTADIVINDRLVSGVKSDRHTIQNNALTADEWRDLPAVVNEPQSVLYDTTDGKLLYVYPSQTDPRKIKVVVEQGVYESKLKRVINKASTVFKIDGKALEDATRYEKVR